MEAAINGFVEGVNGNVNTVYGGYYKPDFSGC